MLVLSVTVKVKPGRGDAFLQAALDNREGARTEPGNIRFDVLRLAAPVADGEPEQFLLFEVYKSAEDFALHQQTPHYIVFRDAVADMMAEPRQGVRYTPVYADDWA